MRTPIAIVALAAALGCVAPDDDLPPSAESADADHFEEEEFSPVEFGRSVGQARLRCSTRHVLGLSYQVVDEMRCLAPDSLVELPAGNGIEYVFTSAMPYFAPDAADALATAALEVPLEIVSGYRTVVQQHVIFNWFHHGTCTVPAAAEPGESRHESGRAVDVRNELAAEDTLMAHGFTPLIGDDGHYDYFDAPDLAGIDVMAFQRLWNRNHPDDIIDTDGDYGPQTALRLDLSPADGFPLGAECVP